MKITNTSHHGVATTVTVLTATRCNTVKAYHLDAQNQLQCVPFGKEKYFNHKLVPVENIGQLALLIIAWSTQNKAILIRGTPKLGLQKLSDRKEANFLEAPEGCRWVMLDFDNQALPAGMNPNSVDAIEYIVHKLPQQFHNVSYFYQFSSSAGIMKPDGTPLKTGLNAHVFFWFKLPIQGKQLSAYFESHCYETGFHEKAFDRSGMPVIKTGVDLSVIRSSVQPHYIGLPIIGKGVTCSLPPEARQGLKKKHIDAVDLPDMEPTLIPDAISLRNRVRNAWKEECGFVPTRLTTRAIHGGIAVSNYYSKPTGPSPSTNRVFLEAKLYGDKQDAAILYFEGEFSPGSFYVKKSSPQLAIRFGDGSTVPLKELSEGAYAHVRDTLKWFSEISHVELPLTDAGYLPEITSFCTARNALILAPTGSGKTTAFCYYAQANKGIIFYAAQTIALVDQMHNDLKSWNHGKNHSPSKRYISSTRYNDFFTGAVLEKRMVYVTTNESLYKFVEAAIAQGVAYELVIDEVQVALDDFMVSNAKNELFERAIARASRSIFMTGTITNLQTGKLLDTISRSCGPLTPEMYSGYQFHPVKANPLFIADVSRFGADFVALLRYYAELKKDAKPIPRTVIIAPTTKMRRFELLLVNYGLRQEASVVSRQESLQDAIENARTSKLPILISSPLFALGLNFEFETEVLWTYFSSLQVDESAVVQTINRANRNTNGPSAEVRLYVGETDDRPVMIPDSVLERLKIEEYLQDEASVQGLLDAHFQVDRVTYLSLRDAEKNTAKSLHRLIDEDAFQNYQVQASWVDTLGATKDDKKLYAQFKQLAKESYLDDVNEQAVGHVSKSILLNLDKLEKLFLKKKTFGATVVQVQREIENEERGVCMALCNVSAADSAYVKPARIRKLFGDLKPYLTGQFNHERTGEWRAAAAEKTLAIIPLLEALKKMHQGQMTGLTFATLILRSALGGAVKALADGEKSLIDLQKQLDRLEEISKQIRNRASDNQKHELKGERFDIARNFLKTIGVNFGKIKVNGKDVINPADPFVPDWDFDSMIAVLNRRAESLKRLPQKPVVLARV